jgi:hypothetical protein
MFPLRMGKCCPLKNAIMMEHFYIAREKLA